ncbi:MAG: zinc-dependent metalloprotease, partial [Planctomycetota bacterium]
YYIEHTTPIRYRRWVRDGILAWNKAFEQVGILNAIEVYQQDATTGAHMDKDPEDLRYSFVRWTNAGMGFAIGPAHVDPETGRIYEADIVMDENFLRSWRLDQLDTELAAAAMSAMDADLADWLSAHPSWDPRYRLARPADRAKVLRYQRALAEGTAEGLEPPPTMDPNVWQVHREALGLPSTTCLYQRTSMFGAAMLRTAMAVGLAAPLVDDGTAGDETLLDGLPEDLVGPLLKDVIMHEVGHTMGLMHNWKGSAAYELADINSEKMKGTTAMTASIMDYAPTNIVVEGDGMIQGDYANIDIGPYDMWAIEWSYTFEDPEPIARRAAEPGLGFSAEEGQAGPDPQAKVWDLGRNSVDMAEARMHFVRVARGRIIERGVDDNESWQKARQLYGHLLGAQFWSVAAASNWIGGAYVNKYRKGDPGATDPITPVEVEHQRRALQFVIDNALNDEAYGLDPQLLRKLAVDQWYDEGYDSTQDYPIHDQVLALQSTALTMLMNPTRLRRIQDNELRVDPGEDTLTLPEVLNALRDTIWVETSELDHGGPYTNPDPMFSTLARNLQREHLNRLIDLARGMRWPNASGATIATLARQQLRDIRDRSTRSSSSTTTRGRTWPTPVNGSTAPWRPLTSGWTERFPLPACSR